jgi:hypothetical protein
LGDLLSLPRLPTRRRHDKNPLVDYSSSYVVTSDQYLTVLKQKALEKEVVDKIREQKAKKREEKKSRWVEHTFTPMEKVTQKNVEKENKVQFNNAWFVTVVRATSERFHNNFKARFRAHLLGHKGFGLGVTSQQQITMRKQRRRKMQLVGHVLVKLQPFTQ